MSLWGADCARVEENLLNGNPACFWLLFPSHNSHSSKLTMVRHPLSHISPVTFRISQLLSPALQKKPPICPSGRETPALTPREPTALPMAPTLLAASLSKLFLLCFV